MKKETTIIVTTSVSVAILVAIAGIVAVQKNKYKKTLSVDNENHIKLLHPEIRDKVRVFINKAKEKGYDLKIISGLRTFAQQAGIYAQGRTAPGAIVSNAPAGSSYHNYGLAIDVMERTGRSRYTEFKDLAINDGWEWGGNFSSLYDAPHFQFTFGLSISKLLDKHNNNEYVNGYIKL